MLMMIAQKRSILISVAVLCSAFAAVPSVSQTRYNVQEMNFDLWCQEEAGLPPDRCDKRLPEDESTFEAYRSKVESYEIPYLQQKENSLRLDDNILHNDPVDNPVTNDPQAQRQEPDTPSTGVYNRTQ